MAARADLAEQAVRLAQLSLASLLIAELARQSGDEEGHERELREAHRLFTEIGASGHAERLAGELAMPAG